jgi:hypothetical protein
MSTKYHHQQQLIHHNVSLIQNNYTLNVTLKIKAEEVRCIKKIENENIADSVESLMKYIFLFVNHVFGVPHTFLLKCSVERQKQQKVLVRLILRSAHHVLKEI